MGFYAEQVLPRVQDQVMDRKDMREVRVLRRRKTSPTAGDSQPAGAPLDPGLLARVIEHGDRLACRLTRLADAALISRLNAEPIRRS